MNSSEIAQKYLDQNFDWKAYDEEAKATLSNLLQQVWRLGILAVTDEREGRISTTEALNLELNIAPTDLKGHH